MGGFFTQCKEVCSPGASKSNGYETVVDSDWAEAVRGGNMEQLKQLLLEDSELINIPVDTYGRRALHLSVNKYHHEIVFYLLSEGAHVNEKAGRDEDTPLHEACKINNVELIHLLLRFGADPTLTNRQRKKPEDVCDAKTKREFRTERLAHIQSLGRPKSYQAISDGLDKIQKSGHVVTVTPPVNFNKNKEKEQNVNSTEHSRSLSGSYSSSWSDSSGDDGRGLPRKNSEWTSNYFVDQVGIELTDVVRFLKSPKSKSVLEAIWDRVTKDPNQLKLRNSDEQLFKLTYAAIFSAAKAHDRTKKSIPKEPAKKVAKRLKKELTLRTNSNMASKDFELTKHQFLFEFGTLLEKVSQELASPK